MAWCPKCRNEYVDGIAVCVDCNTELVEDLELFEKSQLEEMGEEEEVWEPTQEELEEARLRKEDMKKSSVYVKKSERAEEHKSSAKALIGVGAAGIIVLILYWLGIIPLYLNETSKYMITAVLGGAFILFIVIGIQSNRSFKQLKKEGEEEEELEKEIISFCSENITKDSIDSLAAFSEGETEEMKYFKRMEEMKKMIFAAYPNIDQDFAENIADDFYTKTFE